MAAVCRSCGADVLWVKTERGRNMPLDPTPVDVAELENHAGLFVVASNGVAMAATPDQLPDAAFYRSHFATCPDAGTWRQHAGRTRPE